MPNYLSTVTITGKTGPGLTVTSQVLRNVSSLSFDFAKQTLTLGAEDVPRVFDLYEIATITYTIGSHVATVTVST